MIGATDMEMQEKNRVSDRASPAWTAANSLVLISIGYQAILCVVHTHLHAVSTLIVGLSELVIFTWCFALLCKRCELRFVFILTAVMSYLLLLTILRGHVDAKGFRDVLIPILFFELGRQSADSRQADQLVTISIFVVLGFALFELCFLNEYSRIFNIYSYYVSQGNILPGTAWAKDSVLSLNGIRPEGIGRTILPSLFGSHRVSSIFLEPVSLGNFAVIVACWGLAKPRRELWMTAWFLLASLFMIALSDSRYGILTVMILIIVRLVLPRKMEMMLSILPLLCVAALMLIAGRSNVQYSDNILGRLFISGRELLNFDLGMIFGLNGSNLYVGDMGYPAVLINFGLPLCIALWCGLWLIDMRDVSGRKFRAYIVVYVSLILCVSGSSMFALKSAGILWFLLGSCANSASSIEPDVSEMDASSDASLSRREYAY